MKGFCNRAVEPEVHRFEPQPAVPNLPHLASQKVPRPQASSHTGAVGTSGDHKVGPCHRQCHKTIPPLSRQCRCR